VRSFAVAGKAAALLVAVALLIVPLRGRADTPPSGSPTAAAPRDLASPPDAAELRQRGNEAMAAFKPGDAFEAYKRAYELSRDPALLYNMGRALEALEDYPAALDRYDEFSRLASPELRARVPKLDEAILSLRLRVARLSIVCNVPGARVLVRDRTVGSTASPGEALVVSLAAGPATLEVDADGYDPFVRSLALPGGGSLGVQVQLIPKAIAGVLVIDSEPLAAAVLVDGHALGSAPVETSVGSGPHEVVARLPGFHETTTTVVVGVGERRVVTVRLGKTTPITQKWWFWAGVGAIVATSAIVTYAAVTERAPGSGSIPPGQTRAP
jgi:hypothetical protein